LLFRRYVPAVLLGAALLVAILLAPSRPPASTALQAFPPPTFATNTDTGTTAPVAPGAVPAAGDAGATGGAPAVGGTTATAPLGASAPVAGQAPAAGAAAPAAAPVVGAPAAAAPGSTTGKTGTSTKTKTTTATKAPTSGGTTASGPGDTSHCVGGKQFGGLGTAPPCQPTWTGGTNNGGATSSGVTATSIEIVYYREGDSPAVKAIEQKYGIYSNPADQAAFAGAAQTFINSKYELYGRKVHIDFVQSPGNCTTSPPKDSCFTDDAKQIVAQYHPFAVFYENDTNEPAFFTTLSSLGVINWGGWHFADSFDTQQRPYHYDVFTSGDNQAQEFGDWYCKRLANQPAKFAGTTLKGMPRKAGILVQDNTLNVGSAQHLQQIINSCDSHPANLYVYSSDTATSSEQSGTLVSKMQADGVTSVLYFSDPIAPVFFTPTETSRGFMPENVIVGSAFVDYDNLGQSYDQTQWGHAFGIGDLADSSGVAMTEAQTVWNQSGHAGAVYNSANLPWGYLGAIAAGIQQSGPTLNPGTFEKAVLTLPAVGGTRYQPLVKFGPGDYTGISDYREIYWSPTATSPINNAAGTYVSLNNGARYQQGQEPSGAPALPASQ